MTASEPEAIRVAFLVIDALEKLAIPYHVGGSYASSVHGIPRQTQDIDFVIDLSLEQIPALTASAGEDFHVDSGAAERAVVRRSSFNLIHRPSGVKVDLFIRKHSPFDDSEFTRSIPVRLLGAGDREVLVKSAEDTVLRKLLWYRMGGGVSDRQVSDVRGILQIQGDRIDLEYLKHWAARLDLSDMLNRLLTDGGKP